MKRLILTLTVIFGVSGGYFAQERAVKVNFESSAFENSPNVPFNESFIVQGEAGKDIEMVKVNIFNEGKDFVVHSFLWNRYDNNDTETFNIVIPPVLISNSKYDFEVITYKLLSREQKLQLLEQIETRIMFFLENNIYFDGKNVSVNKPRDVYERLELLIDEALKYYESKNMIAYEAPSSLVLDELKRQSDFRFSKLLNRKEKNVKDSVALKLVDEKVKHLTNLVISELKPYINSQLVQHYRKVSVKSVATDKERFTLPVNAGIYAWDKSLSDNPSTRNIGFTPGIGLTVPFNSKTKFASKFRMLDSFGFSMGVLTEPVRDAEGNDFATPWVNLPLYTAIGFRAFKVVRLNAGMLILGEKGIEDFSNLSFIPTVGIALELNLWMGVKK